MKLINLLKINKFIRKGFEFMYIDRRLIFLIIALMLFSSLMTLLSRENGLLSFVITIPGILIAITFHEFAHAFAADKLGDDTPRRQGRLNLNPFTHLDLFGTIMLVFAGFGWGKPVEINPRNFNRDISLSKAEAIVAAAGPIINIILALVFELIVCAVARFAPAFYASSAGFITDLILTSIVRINLGLGIFNLIPLPPLDGSKILNAFLPYNARNWMDAHSQIFEIVFVALWIVGILGLIISPLINLAYIGLTHLCAGMFGLTLL